MSLEETRRPEDVGLCSSRLDRVRAWMRDHVDCARLPGALTLVARHGEIALLDTYGYRDVERAVELTTDTVFRFYSMTKPITSVAVMMLYEEGRFQLDDPVDKFIPAFADMQVYIDGEGPTMRVEAARSAPTIAQLLSHTSGLGYGAFGDQPLSALYKSLATDFRPNDGTLADVVARLGTIPLLFHPGSRWMYGVSTDVLGYLVEVLSGQTFERFLSERIFTPLGMSETAFDIAPDAADRLAALYGPHRDGGLRLLEAPDKSAYLGPVTTFSGGGGLLSTVTDYFRFTEMLRRKGEFEGARLLGRKTVELMTSNHLPGDLTEMGQKSFNETTFSGIGFGLGFSVMLNPAKAKILGTPGEYAWGGAASTAFWIDPEEDMTVIFLTQLLPSSTYPLRRELKVLTYQAVLN